MSKGDVHVFSLFFLIRRKLKSMLEMSLEKYEQSKKKSPQSLSKLGILHNV